MPSRRRFLAIAASWAAIPSFSFARAAGAAGAQSDADTPAPSVWKGVAMGALATMTLVHPDREHARALIGRCVAEIDRLESIFSLYRRDSALSRLNAAGELADPPADLVQLLSVALALARHSGGAFDPTVQPLFRLYADHFAAPGAAASGPPARAIDAALRSVGFEAVELRSGRIRLRRPAMALTLNGIAQGYVTDRVADLLQAGGLRHVLIDLGEARALGHRLDGAPWHAAVAHPLDRSRALLELPLGTDAGGLPALATSAGAGTRFGPDPRLHHLLDPRTGRSADHHASVSVAAARATVADGLSTALSVLAPARIAPLLSAYPSARAWLVDHADRVTMHGAPAAPSPAPG